MCVFCVCGVDFVCCFADVACVCVWVHVCRADSGRVLLWTEGVVTRAEQTVQAAHGYAHKHEVRLQEGKLLIVPLIALCQWVDRNPVIVKHVIVDIVSLANAIVVVVFLS